MPFAAPVTSLPPSRFSFVSIAPALPFHASAAGADSITTLCNQHPARAQRVMPSSLAAGVSADPCTSPSPWLLSCAASEALQAASFEAWVAPGGLGSPVPPPAGRCVPLQTMVFAAAATRGHRSAHSLATGPVMAEPARAHTHTEDEVQTWAAIQRIASVFASLPASKPGQGS